MRCVSNSVRHDVKKIISRKALDNNDGHFLKHQQEYNAIKMRQHGPQCKYTTRIIYIYI